MKLLIHTQWFDPEPNTFKGLSFAKALKQSDIDNFVLTGFPNYPEGKIYPEALIYWIMDYISSGPDDRDNYEISLLKIAELFSDNLNKSDYTYESQLVVDEPELTEPSELRY